MGKEISLPPEVPRKLYVRILGTDRIAHVEILRNNRVIYHVEGKSDDVEIKWEDIQPLDSVTGYYVRVTQSDCHMAWSSPVWVVPEQ